MRTQLIYPLAFYVFYVWILGIINFRSRVGAVRSGKVSLKYFKAFVGEPLPDQVATIGRHYNNQFELPNYFLIGGAAHLAFQPNVATVLFAWAFVVSRLAHSYIHLGKNNVRMRFAAFALGWICVLLLWGQLVLIAIQHG